MIYDKDSEGNIIQRILVKEEFAPSGALATGGRYQAASFQLVVDHAINTWKTLDLSWPYPLSIFSTEWVNHSNFEGDIVQVLVGEDTLTGVLTADVAIGATIIDVSSTVMDNISIGFVMKLDDGTNVNNLGRVVAKDTTNSRLTLETATTNAFLASSPTYCKQTIEFIPGIHLCGQGRVELAKDVVGGSYLPANTILKVRYQNNEGTTTGKIFSFILEYKY